MIVIGRASLLYRKGGKRALDLVLTIAAVPLVVPIMAAMAMLVLFRLGRPVLFRQVRPGRSGRPFELLKFRTMREARAGEDPLTSDAARLGWLGAFLRRTSLDELPELWNVARGEMSLVGPRPLLMEYLSLYSPEQARRHEVRPGMTGLAQVSGRNALTWEEKFRLDVYYVQHYSLTLDMKLLMQTIRAVVTARGVSAEGSATMPQFRGSRT
jgi:sugar transferase EpsL